LQLQVLRFNGREALNQPYRFELQLIGLAPALNPDSLLGQPAFLRLENESGIHGMIQSVDLSDRAAHRIGYRMTLVPYLQRLEQGPRRRVFAGLSVVQVLQRLLEDNGLPIASYRFELPHGHYPRRPFCIQYQESDLTLLQRLCEEEGIHYHFEHAPQGHVLVFAEDPRSFPAQVIEVPVRPHDASQPAGKDIYVRHHHVMPAPPFGFSDRATADVQSAAANQHVGEAGHEILHGDPVLAHRYQAGRRHLERLRCGQREIHGHSTQAAVRGGHIIQVSGHPVAAFNDQWLVTEVQHRGRQFSILESNLPVTLPGRAYRNRFVAIPWSTVFRPALKHPKPSIPGHHLAHVLGRAGQPVMPDEQGYVCVSLWGPDQDGVALPMSRLTQAGHPVLMAGSEVLVSFLDGDPDRPVLCPGALAFGTRPAASPPEPPRANGDPGPLLDWLLNPPDLT
jgi:type VI secretion system secreted protein VgrG